MPYLIAHLETDQRNEVTLPKVDIPLKVARRPVDEHCDEEKAVEIWDWRRSADDKAPGEAHDPVGYIVLFFTLTVIPARKNIAQSTHRFTGELPPATGKESVAVKSRDFRPKLSEINKFGTHVQFECR